MFTVIFQSATEFRIKITDKDNERWEIPHEYPFPHDAQDFSNFTQDMERDYDVMVEHRPFQFTVTRKSTDEVLFSTGNSTFVYSDLYLEITNQKLPTKYAYGFGESNALIELGVGTRTIWTMDHPWVIDDGT